MKMCIRDRAGGSHLGGSAVATLKVRSEAENTHKNGAIMSMATSIMPTARRICPGPVSYTHLAVYKRQLI